jgi:hypothetical protein
MTLARNLLDEVGTQLACTSKSNAKAQVAAKLIAETLLGA